MSRFAARGRARVTGLLALICIGLAAVIYVELGERPWSPRPAWSTSPGGDAAGTAVDLPEPEVVFEPPPLETYSEITDRPLFRWRRRPSPPPDEGAAAEEHAPAEEEFLLRGVAIAGDDCRVGLVERRATGEPLRAVEGESIDGWEVVSVTPDTLVLERGGDECVLEIEKDGAPAEPAEAEDAE